MHIVDHGELVAIPQRAMRLVRSKLQPIPKTRQAARRFLFLRALFEVNKCNAKEAVCRLDIMPRAERRKLARAYAAGEWRRDNPARGLKAA
jgi:hypothetical protein